MWRCDRRPTIGGGGQRAGLGGTEAVAGGVAGEAGATGAERLAVTRHPHEAGKARGAGLKRNENTPAGFKPGHVAQGCWWRPRRWSRTETALAGTAGATPGYRRGDVAWRRPQGGKGQSDGDGAFVCGPGARRRVDVYRAGEGVGRVGETMVRIQTPFPQPGRCSARRHTSLLRLSCRSADTHGRHGRGEGASPTPGIRGSPSLLPHRTPTPGVCTYRSAYLPLPP